MKRPVVVAVVGILLILLALGLAWLTLGQGSDDPPPPPPQTQTEAQPQTQPQQQPEEEEEEEATAPLRPSFDVVRVDENGHVVMAGKSAPDAAVTIRSNGEALDTVTADGRGEWVHVPDAPMTPGSHELTLLSLTPDGTEAESEDVVVLVIPERGSDAPILAVETDARGEQPSRLLQGAAPLADGLRVGVDVVDYDEQGIVTASGRAVGGAVIQLYIDNTFMGRTDVTGEAPPAETAWMIRTAEPVPLGDHTLRVDLLDTDGTVLDRVELPFSRVELAEMPAGLRVVVQPGNSLWRLARQIYGEGMAYTVIYDANKGQIRNPDLIYPGQVFIVPTPQ